jgi:hypothetical protein
MEIVWLLCLYNLYKRQSVLLKGMPFIDWPVLSCDQCIIIAAIFKTRTSVVLTMIKHFNILTGIGLMMYHLIATN